jgi:hypothetical protein
VVLSMSPVIIKKLFGYSTLSFIPTPNGPISI